MEHSSYTGDAQITLHLESRNIRSDSVDVGGFIFNDMPVTRNATEAPRFTVPFSSSYVRTFIFDGETGLYRVENRDGPTRDALTREQVTVRNVLVQLTDISLLPRDREGRRAVATIGEGDGFIFNNGTYRPVRWVKESRTAPMRWYNPNGLPLELLPGVTWINILDKSIGVRIP
jgi:hypothetical protein